MFAADESSVKMSDADFKRISTYIYESCGIKLPIAKRNMVESRLKKRLKITRQSSFKTYFDFVFTTAGKQEELQYMVNAITTNKTDFFREYNHFEFLRSTVLPELLDRSHNVLNVWSAGCSSGEEPYSLAMALSEYMTDHVPFTFRILGTDLSTEVLSKAIRAVYTEDRITDIPLHLRKKYLLRNKSHEQHDVRIIPDLREKVTFQQLNFLEEDHRKLGNFHIIFCRNVLIYFDKPTQEMVLNKLISKLVKGGYLFIGHSESLAHMNLPVQQLRPSVFRKL
ncbi:protein-glutamate O-methyltransferase CheR [Cytophagaceae bacterium DM2B3-1]|uniref:protein-glutamate O-methyltransferase n=1 Tax=Xanthocytophaga flava TaxID=3048013 RepID=A0ABT7CMH0_9BACT|nr:protein-glutamate O-methyltransferase CheR [Xanthocytophaga flavus]MDJ1493869.1 protein-glutamate O-methyltransferase CheR [Xanthocytophaga flavus]